MNKAYQEALSRIERAKINKVLFLDLKGVGLKDSDLEVLLPVIKQELPNLTSINLMENQFTCWVYSKIKDN